MRASRRATALGTTMNTQSRGHHPDARAEGLDPGSDRPAGVADATAGRSRHLRARSRARPADRGRRAQHLLRLRPHGPHGAAQPGSREDARIVRRLELLRRRLPAGARLSGDRRAPPRPSYRLESPARACRARWRARARLPGRRRVGRPGDGRSREADAARDHHRPRGRYGCKHVDARRDVGDQRFDERLVLYGGRRLDFTSRVEAPAGSSAAASWSACISGSKSAASAEWPGLFAGVNPVYLVRKGTMPLRFACQLVGRNLAANGCEAFGPSRRSTGAAV